MSDSLSSEERYLLDALQASDSPDPLEQQRVKQRVFRELGLAATALGAATTLGGSATQGISSATGVSAAAGAQGAASSGGALASGAAASGGAAGAAGGAAGMAVAGLKGVGVATVAKAALVKGVLSASAVLGMGVGTWMVLDEAPPVDLPQETRQLAEPAHGGRASAPIGERELEQSAVAEPAGSVTNSLAEPLKEVNLKKAVAGRLPANSRTKKTQSPVEAQAVAPEAATAPSRIEQEAELLRQAHRALQSGSPSGAVGPLLEHRKLFPGGVLSIERDGTLALARCKLGQASGRSAAVRFQQAHPESPMLRRLQSACGLQED